MAASIGSGAPVATRSAISVGGDRGEQDAVPVVAGGGEHAGRPGSGPRIGALSGVPGRSPASASTSVVLGESGQQVGGGAEQVAARPRR